MPYYFSLQYSAIQKTIMRHNRLWSIAGISHGLAHLNEVTLPTIIKNHSGDVLVAGGGKFMARFDNDGCSYSLMERRKIPVPILL